MRANIVITLPMLCALLLACGGETEKKKEVSAFLTGWSHAERDANLRPTSPILSAATTQQLIDLRKGIAGLERMTSASDAATTVALLRKELEAISSGTLPAREVAGRANDIGTSIKLAQGAVIEALRLKCEQRLRDEEGLIAQLIQANGTTRVPDELKFVQDRFEAVLVAFYEQQYTAVLQNLDSLSSDTKKLVEKYR